MDEMRVTDILDTWLRLAIEKLPAIVYSSIDSTYGFIIKGHLRNHALVTVRSETLETTLLDIYGNKLEEYILDLADPSADQKIRAHVEKHINKTPVARNGKVIELPAVFFEKLLEIAERLPGKPTGKRAYSQLAQAALLPLLQSSDEEIIKAIQRYDDWMDEQENL